MTKTEWRKLRLALLERQGVVCSTCGKKESLARRLYAHEEWEYDESTKPAIAHIRGVSLVCWHCHACEHWGCTKSLVRSGALMAKAIDDTIAHFCRLNGATEADFKAHEADASKAWIRRCKRKWRIDYGVFTEWTAKTFQRDPLNDEPWPVAISSISQDGFRPTMAEITALPSSRTSLPLRAHEHSAGAASREAAAEGLTPARPAATDAEREQRGKKPCTS